MKINAFITEKQLKTCRDIVLRLRTYIPAEIMKEISES